MSLSSHLVEHLHNLEKQWEVSVRSLPERHLVEQRNILREKAVDIIGGRHLSEALVLRLLNAEIERRNGGDLLL
ncbi:MAG: hypothetical protein ACOH2M_26530 [Cypionkella sp.]